MEHAKDTLCPNCNKSMIRFIFFDPPRSYSTYVGMAVHREIDGHNGDKIPEAFCYLDAEDWQKIPVEMR